MAEKILQDTFKDELAFFSAGISPIAKASMDPRSIEFLTESNINDVYHMPKKINNKMIENSDLVLAMDTNILIELNKSFKKYMNKFKLFSYGQPTYNLSDPYKYSKDDYKEIMINVKKLSLNFRERFKI